MIYLGITDETRGVVYLQKIWLTFFVKQNVEPKKLKAHLVWVLRCIFLSGTARPVVMKQIWLNRQKCFHDDVLDLVVDLFDVPPLLLEPPQHRKPRPLVPGVIVKALRVFETGVHFIDRVVGQMHEHILHIRTVHFVAVFFSCKPDKPVLVQEHLEWLC